MDDHQRQELEAISNLNRNIDISGNDLDNVAMQYLRLGSRSSRVPSATEINVLDEAYFRSGIKVIALLLG